GSKSHVATSSAVTAHTSSTSPELNERPGNSQKPARAPGTPSPQARRVRRASQCLGIPTTSSRPRRAYFAVTKVLWTSRPRVGYVCAVAVKESPPCLKDVDTYGASGNSYWDLLRHRD